MRKFKSLVSLVLLIAFLAAAGTAAVISFPDYVSAGYTITTFPVTTFPIFSIPPIIPLSSWKLLSTSSGAGSFTDIGGLDVNDMNMLAVGNRTASDNEIHFYNGKSWLKKYVDFNASSLEWSGGSDPILYATDSTGNSVYMSNNPTADFPSWQKIGGAGTGTGQFDYPMGMFTSSTGTLYVVDSNNKRIQYRSGGEWSLIAGPSDAVSLVDVCLIGRTTYVTDFFNNCIYYKSPMTIGWSKIEDPLLLYPTFMDSDSEGNLYVVAATSSGSSYARNILKYSGGNFQVYVSAGTGPGHIGIEGDLMEEISINNHDIMFYGDNAGPGVYKKKCDINALSGMSINGDGLQLMEGQTVMNWSVDPEVTSALIEAVPLCAYGSITGNGSYPLDFGLNSFTITCTPETGASQDYTVNITRELSDNALLSEITLNSVPIAGFNPNIFAYSSITVPNSASSIDIDATPQDVNANVTGTGTIPLSEGDNLIILLVAAQDGIVVQQYVVNITKEAGTASPSPSPSTATSPSPSPSASASPAPTPTASASPAASPTPSPTTTPAPTATPTATPSATTSPDPTASAATSPPASPEPSQEPEEDTDEIAGPDLPTPKEMMEEMLRKSLFTYGLIALAIAGAGVFAGVMIAKKGKGKKKSE
ncbi:MAG: cadherin-like beta sandwich domain-containing protein [Clostridia bacterium]|nr:cadherin-like beta sandwich domain-containing protein [Clostridia bacterium]